jgi:hypothetical protein
VRARRHTQKEVRLENALTKVVEGSKAHSKGGRVKKRTTRGVRARRFTKKEAGLENTLHKVVEGSKAHSKNALPKVVEGSKAHLKRGKVRKRTSGEGSGKGIALVVRV